MGRSMRPGDRIGLEITHTDGSVLRSGSWVAPSSGVEVYDQPEMCEAIGWDVLTAIAVRPVAKIEVVPWRNTPARPEVEHDAVLAKTRWEIAHADEGSSDLANLLGRGWEPFAVTREAREEMNERYRTDVRMFDVIWLRREVEVSRG